MTGRRAWHGLGLVTAIALAATAVASQTGPQHDDRGGPDRFDERIVGHAVDMFTRGRQIFRFDTFGDEEFWGDTLRLHEAIAGAANGGVGPGLSPTARSGGRAQGRCRRAPAPTAARRSSGRAGRSRRSRRDTLALLELDAVVGVIGTVRRANGGLRVDRHQVRALPLDRRRLVRARASAAASTAGRTATSTSARSSRWRPTCSRSRTLLGVDEDDGAQGAAPAGARASSTRS